MSRFSKQFFTIYKWFSLLCLQLGTDFENRLKNQPGEKSKFGIGKRGKSSTSFLPRLPNSSLVADRKRAAAILMSHASQSFLAILMADAFSFAASQLTVIPPIWISL